LAFETGIFQVSIESAIVVPVPGFDCGVEGKKNDGNAEASGQNGHHQK